MRRHLLGILALLLLIAGAFLYVFPPGTDFWEMMCASFIRAGAVLAVLWLAYPQVSRVPQWMYVCGLIGALTIAVRPKWAFWVIPVLIALVVLWRLGPRTKREKT